MSDSQKNESANEFQQAAESSRSSLVGEFWDFLKYNKKWWLLPILISFLLLGGLLILANVSSVAPFIYTLF